jgi:sugar phosphate isomerase/epimerase
MKMSTVIDLHSRRIFIKRAALMTSLLPLLDSESKAASFNYPQAGGLKVHVFSKHLQFLNYRDMADAAKEIGFDGVDVTVRPKGHVLPDRVEDDLPKVVEALRNAGLSPQMMTTAVQDAGSNTDKNLLAMAAKAGIRYYRMNWFNYPEGKSIPEAIEEFKIKLQELGQLNKKLGLTGCYQNHSGNLAGASLWELWEVLKKADHRHMGVQYDIRHALVEGGLSWRNGLKLIAPQIRTLAIKDFIWVNKGGKWEVEDVPLGEGMVDFKSYFKLLKEYQINVPVSLHLEYPLGGAEHGATEISVDKKVIFAAMKKDLTKLHALWEGD